MNIGKLEAVPVRDLWAHEQYDFSSWLAKEENLSILGEDLGIAFTGIETEQFVGAFRCDIVAKDDNNEGKIVIIENQLESSNHDHLGKIITYASGLDASKIIWIVTNARSEHKSAIEWLNNNTKNDINFFLIELKAYRIGDSLPAPKFEIVEMPNDYIKNGNMKSRDKTLNRSQAARYDFWSRFIEYSSTQSSILKNRKANTKDRMSISLGVSNVRMEIKLTDKAHCIRIALCIRDNKDLYQLLEKFKDDIEKDVMYPLIWKNIDNLKQSEIIFEIPGLNFDDDSNYEDLMHDTLENLVRLKDVYIKYLKKIGTM